MIKIKNDIIEKNNLQIHAKLFHIIQNKIIKNEKQMND
jgi:hypothetical protein